jgi:hypothetical protein
MWLSYKGFSQNIVVLPLLGLQCAKSLKFLESFKIPFHGTLHQVECDYFYKTLSKSNLARRYQHDYKLIQKLKEEC